MDQSNSQLKNALNKIRTLINKSVLEKNIKDSILVPIPIIEDKIDTQQIHVGIVGESAQDKVALLNSLLKTDFFRFPSADSQHRQVRTLIERAPQQSLAVTFASGKVCNTRNNMLRLTRRFLPERYHGFSLVDKFKYFFGIHNDIDANARLVEELYHNMVASSDANNDSNPKNAKRQISSIRLGLPLESLPEYLVIVDTPTLGVKNDTSQRIINETVKILCDEIIVLTPARNPLSETVTSFISKKLGPHKEICRVFVTGIEGVRGQDEREDLLMSISDRAQSEFQIPSRNIIAAPLTLDLALKGIKVTTSLNPQNLNSIPSEEREILREQYQRDLERCFTAYSIRKETAVVEKKFSVVEDYIRFIQHLLQETTQNNIQSIERIRQQMVPPLQDFLRDFYKGVEVRSKTRNIGQNVIDECRGYMQTFVDSVFLQIDQAGHEDNPKDAVQGIMKRVLVTDEGNKTCAKCYQSYIYKLDYVKGVYRDIFVELESQLRRTYGLNDIQLRVGERLRPVPIMSYNMKVSTSELTTFRLKRLFTSLSTIQAQMKQTVQNTCNTYFGNLARLYSSNLNHQMRELDAEVTQIRNQLINQYKAAIDKRIADFSARERTLRSNNLSLASLKTIVTKVIGYEVQ